jgi:hypothetical protein
MAFANDVKSNFAERVPTEGTLLARTDLTTLKTTSVIPECGSLM